MTVGEMIEVLSEFPEDATVFIYRGMKFVEAAITYDTISDYAGYFTWEQKKPEFVEKYGECPVIVAE